MTTSQKTDERSGYIAGLRALADILDANPELPVPFVGTGTPLTLFFVGGDTRAQLAEASRAFPGMKAKGVRDGEYGSYFDLDVQLHGLQVRLTASRDDVCERIVTGSREITETVPDPDALANLPTVTVTKTVEDVEWVCHPILAEASA